MDGDFSEKLMLLYLWDAATFGFFALLFFFCVSQSLYIFQICVLVSFTGTQCTLLKLCRLWP